jgi:hypothetical protein
MWKKRRILALIGLVCCMTAFCQGKYDLGVLYRGMHFIIGEKLPQGIKLDYYGLPLIKSSDTLPRGFERVWDYGNEELRISVSESGWIFAISLNPHKVGLENKGSRIDTSPEGLGKYFGFTAKQTGKLAALLVGYRTLGGYECEITLNFDMNKDGTQLERISIYCEVL